MPRDLATWTTFPADTADVLSSGLQAEIDGKDISRLQAERDEALVAVMVALREVGRS